ncbi:VOC family protein [Paludibaculum fermentans]|uniref:VOC family protein n=1 Tax=Paludibaculum fermentans TaxID=1473598 RepID=A0A7S7NQ84_PALFE|nr:VOC family protein [Paludibaculum fermentans]QOY87733.1 VOC family protein [Paludibaculum fermentans]
MAHNENLPSTVSLVMFGVDNLARSVAFYRDVVSLPLRSSSEEFTFFAAGPVTLALSVPLGRAVQPRAGAMELVFSVHGVLASFAALKDRGCRFVQEPREVSPGSWAATFTDPDGHRLTIFGPK